MAEWKRFINASGDLEFPKYLYKMLKDTMKTTLDLGTLVCADPVKLRAFKEQIKSTHTKEWEDIASAFEFFDIVEPCVCDPTEFCVYCGGSRYILSEAMSADQMQSVFSATSVVDDGIAEKLRKGMEKAYDDIAKLKKNVRSENG